ncbi:ABC transporter ATP-binding protein [Pseudomonas mosselii]|uniref:ABC transporter ATP-binding protein n=1 Tax=Pseudomonas mosselii TaxID=78327 RepID=UPI0007702FF5|nr:ABC transporter ATP-binding protein [Pseudomonas mosselii]AMK30025.1 ATP binding component of ABC-transporter [Pseudomonas putida]MEA3234851.1 ABC transporter ATP-binding protein [Pseudomonas mosselii]UWS65976.1 ABC transporter ATP-binding protein [Pseudomonas mosselii]
MTLLRVTNLGKAYRGYRSEWQRIARWFYLPVRPSEEHWVLKGISFSIERGEAVGIVGQNGAGKSTLLKMITGTLQPTQGSVQVGGRIAAILELGMGFNPELTGRQNVYHAGGLMGFGRQQIDSVIGEIEAFAEIGTYFDEPVRTYSSGMQVRVAFSVATAFRPDILIVDEALSVGDARFQHKCMQRIRRYQQEGMSLLLVSHAPDTIRMFCQRGIYIKDGAIEKIGDAASVMDYYQAAMVMGTAVDEEAESALIADQALHEDRDAKFVVVDKASGPVSVNITCEHGYLQMGSRMTVSITTEFASDWQDPHVGFGIRTKSGIVIYEANTYTLGGKLRPVQQGERLSVDFSFDCLLYPDTYELMVGVADGGYDRGSFRIPLFFDQSMLVFEVLAGSVPGWSGMVDIRPEVSFS